MRRTLTIIASLAVLAGAAGGGLVAQQRGGGAQTPKLEVEPLWPKPFPVAEHWVPGSVSGVGAGGEDRLWVVHRGVDSLQNNEKGPTLEPWASSCCFAAPQVLAFDAAGNMVANWDPKTGSGYDWPANASGIAVDDKGNVWIGSGLPTPSLAPAGRGARGPAPDSAAAGGRAAGGRGDAAGGARGDAAAGRGDAAQGRGRGGAPGAATPPADAQVLKFDKTGKFLLQIGKGGQAEGSDSPTGFNRPGALAVDSAANELYVADGFGNHRIAGFDAGSGAFKRSWGAYGEKPTDTEPGKYDPAAAPSKQFRTLSCVKLA